MTAGKFKVLYQGKSLSPSFLCGPVQLNLIWEVTNDAMHYLCIVVLFVLCIELITARQMMKAVNN